MSPDETEARAPEGGASSYREVFGSRPVQAVLALIALGVALQFSPWFRHLRFVSPEVRASDTATAAAPSAVETVGEAAIENETVTHAAPITAAPRAARGPIARGPSTEAAMPPVKDADLPPVPIVDPSGRALDGFFDKLSRVERKEASAIARIAHFGDSLIVSDFVSSTLRRELQTKFGDAGHGFVLIANAWPSYFHADVERYATAGWKVSRIVGPLAPDGWHGLGGVSFQAEKHALARFGTAKTGDFGRHVSRFVVSYVEAPGGGSFQVRLDGKDHALVSTHGPEKRARYYEVVVPDGPHELELQTTAGESRLFGVILERSGPGVVLDALGVQGARIRFLDKQDDAHWAEQLRSRDPDLVVYEFGANESGDGFLYPMPEYYRTMKDVIAQAQRALPGKSCLIVGAMDRAVKQGDEIVSVRVIPSLVEEQRKVAAELGCAFFNTYEAMGGRGSMPVWVRRELGQADLTHPTGAGAERIGRWLFYAMMRLYDARAR